MKFTLRALVAVAMLLGYYLVALAVVVGLVWGAYELAVHHVTGYVVVKVAAAAIFVALAFGRAIFTRRRGDETPSGLALSRERQPRLWAEVEELAELVGTRAPDEIRLVAAVNAAVSEGSRWMGLVPGVRRLYIGVPLLLGLTDRQLRSVVAHELGHYSGRHVALGGVTYRGKEAIERTIHELGPGNWIGKLLRSYGHLYLAVSHSVNRRQELEADAYAARAAGRAPAIKALQELRPLDAAWRLFLHGYADLGAPHGWYPERLFRGFDQLLAAATSEEQLARIRDAQAPEVHSVFNSHPPTSERVAALEASPDDGVVDASGPALDILDDPDAAFAELERLLYDGSGLSPNSWEAIVAQAGAARAQESAEALATSLSEARLGPFTLEHLAEHLRVARAATMVSALTDGADHGRLVALAGALVGDASAHALVHHERASYRPNWAGSWELVDLDGVVLDPWKLATAATTDPDAVAPWLESLRDRGVPLDEVVARVPDARPPIAPDSPRNRILGAAAPVTGTKARFLLVLDSGLLLKRPNGGDRAAAWVPTPLAGRDGSLLPRVLKRPVADLVADPLSEHVPWDEIASAQFRRGLPMMSSRLTIEQRDGTRRRIKLPITTRTLGQPWPAMKHHLGDRFRVAGIG